MLGLLNSCYSFPAPHTSESAQEINVGWGVNLRPGTTEASNTIIGATFEPHKMNPPGTDAGRPRLFKIRGADSHGQRSSANILIKRRYAWRGYHNAGLPDQQTANRITLTATDHDAIIGTITVGLDGPEGLHAEDTFADEVASLREAGHRICEFTKLAMDPVSGAKQVLASLFHVAYIVAYRFKGFDTLLIEVNPRHVNYYTRMLGCSVIGEERLNRRVNAPAVLLHLDFRHTLQQICKFGGRAELAATERSLYPYSFSLAEEAGIIARLQKSNWSTERPVR